MDFVTRITTGLGTALLIAALVPASAAAKAFSGGSECPTQKEGEALTGAVYIKFTPNLDATFKADVFIRLRKAQKLQVVECSATVPDPKSDCDVMLAVTAACADPIRDAFYGPGSNKTIGLHTVSEIGALDSTNNIGQTSRKLLADIVVTAK